MVPKEAHRRLLVEGSDDKHTVIHLMKAHGVDWGIPPAPPEPWLPFVQDCNGISGVLNSIGPAATRYSRLGIVIDADTDAQARFESVCERLKTADVTPPSSMDPNGCMFYGYRPGWRVGIWVMPDNKLRGALEEFLSELVPDGDVCWAYAGEATEAAVNHGASYETKDTMKARIHAWLAWQKEPGRPFGTAVKARCFEQDRAQANRFVDWFRRVFADDGA